MLAGLAGYLVGQVFDQFSGGNIKFLCGIYPNKMVIHLSSAEIGWVFYEAAHGRRHDELLACIDKNAPRYIDTVRIDPAVRKRITGRVTCDKWLIAAEAAAEADAEKLSSMSGSKD